MIYACRMVAVATLLASGAAAPAQVATVVLPAGVKPSPGETPRVLLFLVRAGHHERSDPTDAPFYDDPQPVFGQAVTAEQLTAGGGVLFGPGAEGFAGGDGGLGTLKDLAPGAYRAQAALVLSRRDGGQWSRTAGNWYSDVRPLDVPAGGAAAAGLPGPVVLELATRTEARPWPAARTDVELFTVRSAALSAFAGRDVVLRAGVRPPARLVPGRRYAAVYTVPGFGGDHFGALSAPAPATPAGRLLRDQTFEVVLDPNHEHGHTLFVDSAVNGPWGAALTTELVPALEARYPLIARPNARMLRGHSSGGWATLWLATRYPAVFGAAWGTSPDPVDFRRFQSADVYAEANLFAGGGGRDRASKRARRDGDPPGMTIRQETAVEEAIAPGNAGGEQWASWQACWGTRAPGGLPTPLFDPKTGTIDRAEAEAYRRFDLAARLRADPAALGPVYRRNVRLLVGTRDDYFLNLAVGLLKADLDRLCPAAGVTGAAAGPGYVGFVEGATHSSIARSPAVVGIAGEMVAHLKAECPDALE